MKPTNASAEDKEPLPEYFRPVVVAMAGLIVLGLLILGYACLLIFF
jgi:hypothetical protein